MKFSFDKPPEKDKRGSVGRVFRKVALAVAMITPVFPGLAQDKSEGKGIDSSKEKTNTEKTIVVDAETKPDDSTYHLTADDFKQAHNDKTPDNKSLDSKEDGGIKVTKLEIANHFDTDSDNISPEAQKEISAQFESFLSQVTPENADKFIKLNFKVFASSDERPTKNFGGSNKMLSEERGKRTIEILKYILQNYEFENLPQDVVEQIKSKIFGLEMPTSETGKEMGVTYITDLKNPNGQGNYTEDEVSRMKLEDPILYEKLLEKCRKITFSLEFKEVPAEPEKAPASFLDSEHNRVVFIVDNSPSINEKGQYLPSSKFIAKILSEMDPPDGQKYTFGSFDAKGLGSLSEAKDLNDVSDKINNLDGRGDGSRELSLTSAIQVLEKLQYAPGEKTLLKIITDEPLQDAYYGNYLKLKALALEHNVTIHFAYGEDSKQTLNEISLDRVGEIIINNVLAKWGHPLIEKILKSKDGRTVEDHLFEIYGKDVVVYATSIANKNISEAKTRILNSQTYLKNNEVEIVRTRKMLDNPMDKDRDYYKAALLHLAKLESNKKGLEEKVIQLRASIDQYSEDGKEVQTLAEAYVTSQKKDIFLNKDFAELMNRGSTAIGTEQFKRVVNLSKGSL